MGSEIPKNSNRMEQKDEEINDEWSVTEEGFDPKRQLAAESIFSLGNGAMGQRANFEESYGGETFTGSYAAGVYYPDKTKVGWWKIAYPEYYAKVLNAPSWIGIGVEINGEELDLNKVNEVSDFRRELNMKEGFLKRSFEVVLQNQCRIRVNIVRFLSMKREELGAIRYEITPVNKAVKITYKPTVDAGIKNNDAHWDEVFWETQDCGASGDFGFVKARTYKTGFEVLTFMRNSVFLNGKQQALTAEKKIGAKSVSLLYRLDVRPGESCSLVKLGGYLVSLRSNPSAFYQTAAKLTEEAAEAGFEELLAEQKQAWQQIWAHSDIQIKGDPKAQQAVRYNIFQLNQTYTGKHPELNIGPKGFSGEKYGGSTYWDTEAFCFPFYLSSRPPEVARNLLIYRYNHLQKAIENAQKLGFTEGAALYPMVTMNGEECHNEWEITFEEIHRNGAIAYAIYNFVNYTGDENYLAENGLEVLVAISRFWAQRVNWSKLKNQFVILGVTGPNEYENNVNNNFHTNYIARWCLKYTIEQLQKLNENNKTAYDYLLRKTGISGAETELWKRISEQIYLPYSEPLGMYLQQDGFLDKDLKTVAELKATDRPLNQKWSWDRILRSPYIKQADVLQCIYFFENDFTPDVVKKHFDFYEPMTVHESSLSPGLHSILAAHTGQTDKAYELFLRSVRLDLDDYNKELKEGLHITSMALARLCIVEGFAGMKVIDGILHFKSLLPEAWESCSFKMIFRERILEVEVSKNGMEFQLKGEPLDIVLNGEKLRLKESKEKRT